MFQRYFIYIGPPVFALCENSAFVKRSDDEGMKRKLKTKSGRRFVVAGNNDEITCSNNTNTTATAFGKVDIL